MFRNATVNKLKKKKSSPGIIASNSMLPYELGIIVIISKIWEKQTVHDSFIHFIKSMIFIKKKKGVCSCVALLIFTDDKKESFSLLKAANSYSTPFTEPA